MIGKNKITLKSACKMHDDGNTGIITLGEFQKSLQDTNLKFSSKIMNYLLILFYSHNYQLSSVPYKHFIKAYGGPERHESECNTQNITSSDEHRAEMTRHYLAIMAEKMIKLNTTVRDIFKTNKHGLLMSSQFIKGLKLLDMGDISNEDIKLMLEALQYEDERVACISIEELEEILSHYGVKTQRELDIYRSNSESNHNSSNQNVK